VRSLVIVDDNAGFRARARTILEAEGFRVVGEAEDGQTAISVCRELQPDVVLLDIGLPDVDGFEVTTRLQSDGPRAPMVVLTSSRDASDYRVRIRRSPARGFVPKDELSGAAIAALIAVP